MRHQTVYRRPTVVAGVSIVLVMAVTGIFAPFLAPHDPYAANPRAVLCPPVSCASDVQSHVLGTDHLGRDVLSRIVTSFRTNLYIGLLGSFWGILAAWLLVIVRSIRGTAPTPDMARPLLGLPFYGLAILTYIIGVFLSISVMASVGVSLLAITVCAGVLSAVLPMALVYGSVMRDGASSNPVRLAVRRGIELSPVGFSLAFLMGLFIEFSLSFLGIGVPHDIPSLGNLTAHGRAHLVIALWISVFPLGIVLVAVGAFLAIVIPVGSGLIPASQKSPNGALSAQAGVPAGFWKRLAAFLIDFAVVIVFYAIYTVISLRSELVGTILGIAFLTAFVGILVASPGKRALGLSVLRTDGSRVGLGRKLSRSCLAWVLLGLTCYISFLLIVFRRDKCALQDLICDTVVVRLR